MVSCVTSGARRITRRLDVCDQLLATSEFLVVDTETNGLGGDGLEVVEVGAVLVAHNAPFDRRALRRMFDVCGLDWPDPPVLCTAAMARVLLPLQRVRRLAALAEALDIEVAVSHRALPDAETCARVFCALFGRLCAAAATVDEAMAVLKPRRARRGRPRIPRLETAARPDIDFSELPRDPGVYLFRDQTGRTLYVGKSVSIRSRARAHFAPSHAPSDWTPHASIVDYRPTRSELGALVLENRLIKELRPPGNVRLARRDDRLVYIRCRLDIPFPILEVAPQPAAGHSVSIGPVRGRALAAELVEQIESLFGLRHCGRRLVRRQWPSAYGQMGRCLSPCLGDLDPNLYRRRLDAALNLFLGDGGQALLGHVLAQMQAAADAQRFERAAWLRRRAGRLRVIVRRLGGVLEATHVRPRLILATHPVDAERRDAFWLVGGRLVDWGPLPDDLEEVAARTEQAVKRAAGPGTGAHIPPDEIDEVRILGTYLASHPDLPQLGLEPAPPPQRIEGFLRNGSGERELDDLRGNRLVADRDA